MASYGFTFSSGDTVTPTRLNSARTVSAIQTADIADAQITASKLAANSVNSTKILAETITNAAISPAAAIAHSKLANITAGQVLLGNASNVPTATALTGDVTVTSGGVTAIADGAITAAKLSGAQSGSQPIYGARAWALVNHGANTISASGNVTSLTDNGTGNVTLNFTTAMASASYSVVVTPQHASGTGNCLANFGTRAAGSVQILQTSASFTIVGDNIFSVAVFQ